LAITPRDYIIGVIIFTIIVGSCAFIMSELKSDNPTLGDDSVEFQSFNSTFYKYNEVSSTVGKWQLNMENVSQDNSVLGVWDSLISGGWSILSLLGSSFSFMNGVFVGFAAVLGIPTFVVTLMYLIVIVIIIFSVYSAVFRTQI
jgi:hypothetical protein